MHVVRAHSAPEIVEVGTIDGEHEGNLANAMPAVLHKTTHFAKCDLNVVSF